jgi:hypothetical protein
MSTSVTRSPGGEELTAAARAARDYLDRGYLPIPVPFRQKAPCFKNWQALRVSAETLPRFFPDQYAGNIGLLTGDACGLVDVDLDCPEARAAATTVLPDTAMIHGRPGSPCCHRWYRVEGPAPANLALTDLDGHMLVELRANGRQTILPPSVHPSGETLAWHGGWPEVPAAASPGRPALVPAAELRDLVHDLAAVSLLARHWPAQGSRQEAALALAGGLLRAGRSVIATQRLLRAVAAATSDEEGRHRLTVLEPTARKLAAGEPVSGWSALAPLLGPAGAAVVDRARSWLRCGPAIGAPPVWEEPIPFHEHRVPEFPIECLPEPFAGYVAAVSAGLQTPPDLAALLGLAVCGAALAKGFRVVVREGWEEPLNLYCVVALAPGERKSSVFELLLAPVREFEAWLQECQGPEIAAAASARRVLEGRLKGLEGKAAKCEDWAQRRAYEQQAQQLALELEGQRVPELPQLLCDDVTPEKLANLLASQGGRVLQASTEGTPFEIVKGRYSAGSNFEVYLKAHCGDDLRVHRIGRGADVLVQPALSAALTVQPDVIQGLAAQASLAGRGFLARWLYALPRSRVGRRAVSPPPVPAAVKEAYRQLVLDLWRLGHPQDESGPDLKSGLPVKEPPAQLLRLAPEADELLRAFEAALEPRLGPDGDLALLAGWANKLAGTVARLAGILHALRAVGGEIDITEPLPAQTVVAALVLGRDYLLPHARAAFGLMAGDPRVGLAQALLGGLGTAASGDPRQAPPRCLSRRSAWQQLKHRLPRVEDLDPVLDLLVRHHYLAPLPGAPQEGPGRRPSQQYAVNPRLFGQPSESGRESATVG